MQVLSHGFDKREIYGFWQVTGLVMGRQLVLVRHEEFPEPFDEHELFCHELARELFDAVPTIYGICFDTSIIRVFKQPDPSWGAIGIEVDMIIKCSMGDDIEEEADKEDDDFRRKIVIRENRRPDFPWHRTYAVNRLVSAEKLFCSLHEIGKATPEIIKCLAGIEGIERIGIAPMSVTVSISQKLDCEKEWPRIRKDVIGILTQYLADDDQRVKKLEQMVGI